jgi:hypothetical protein
LRAELNVLQVKESESVSACSSASGVRHNKQLCLCIWRFTVS